MSRLAILALALALGAPLPACSSPVMPPVPNEPAPAPGPATSAPRAELRATVRIDAEPGAKRFQGVWLELSGGARWVIDYRAREVWRSFADRAVLVSGRCYEPKGQAIRAQHFEVDRMRMADPGRPDVPLLEVGPEARMRGTFAEVAYPEGSKLAGSKDLVFRAESGAEYRVLGAEPGKLAPGQAVAIRAAELERGGVTIDARPVERNLAYTAGPGGRYLWLLDVLDASAGERDPGRTYGACPGES
jgi:hypothetical protein